jgi:hypothetical protein
VRFVCYSSRKGVAAPTWGLEPLGRFVNVAQTQKLEKKVASDRRSRCVDLDGVNEQLVNASYSG